MNCKIFICVALISLLFASCENDYVAPNPTLENTLTNTPTSIIINTATETLTITPSPQIYENTTRSGLIIEKEIWKGTITITGDIIINAGSILIIEPGTIVKFSAGSDDQSHGNTTPMNNPGSSHPNDPSTSEAELSSIDLEGGTLSAVGTLNDPIVFTSSATNPKWGDWQSIHYHKEGSKLVLEHTIIEFAYYGVNINSAADDSTLVLKNNIIRQIVACGICIGYDQNQPVAITISGNDISFCGHEAIDTTPNASLIIESNIIHDNLWSYGNGPYGDGIVIHSNNSVIRDNEFSRNRVGIKIFDELEVFSEDNPPNIFDNIFANNEKDIKCDDFSCPYLSD